MTCSQHASRNEFRRAQTFLQMVVQRNPDLLWAGLRTTDGTLRLQCGDQQSSEKNAQASGDTHCQIPIVRGRERYGQVELHFSPIQNPGFLGWLRSSNVRFITFVVAACFLGNLLVLHRTLRQLNPSKVIPPRVKAAFDSLTNGLILVDNNERIVLANRAFAETVGASAESLLGTRASKFDWCHSNDDEQSGEDKSVPPAEIALPWRQSLDQGVSQSGNMIGLNATDEQTHTFLVNSVPIIGSDNKRRGALASFEDVTELMEKKNQLLKMLQVLRESREKIRCQNSELQILATRDTLTGCFNRRSLFSEFESLWNEAVDQGLPLSCLMVDVDHFKSVNDNHGHVKGDEVLKTVAEILRQVTSQKEIVGRFGGEEFCILLPGRAIEEAQTSGEQIRKAIEDADSGGVKITVSVGASAMELGATDQQQLLDEADQCLYVAKRNGRNQVVCWNEGSPGSVVDRRGRPDGSKKPINRQSQTQIPFPAVTALISALGYRHAYTAEHCRRVADLCVAVADTMMLVRESYVVEISALLHDIGKIGVPDSILLKPGPLTEDEWQVMRDHDRIGVEIVRTAFDCQQLTDILKTHTAWYGGRPDDPSLPRGDDIPLGARILAIADAYDAMVTNRVYRKAMPQTEVFAELRLCGGKQFDPQLVEEFIAVVLARDDSRRVEVSNISNQTALKIGEQIEHLAEALDNHDVTELGVLAKRLSATARQSGIEPIASLAGEISEAVDNEPELQLLIQLTKDLIELCRATQSVYLSDVVDYEDVRMGQ